MEIEPTEGAVKLTVIHEIDQPKSKIIEAVSGGWPKILSSLKSLLETGEPLRWDVESGAEASRRRRMNSRSWALSCRHGQNGGRRAVEASAQPLDLLTCTSLISPHQPAGRSLPGFVVAKRALKAREQTFGGGKSGLPEDTVAANGRRGRPQGKCHRKHTASGAFEPAR